MSTRLTCSSPATRSPGVTATPQPVVGAKYIPWAESRHPLPTSSAPSRMLWIPPLLPRAAAASGFRPADHGTKFTVTLDGRALTIRPTMAASVMTVQLPKAGGGFAAAQVTLPPGRQGGLTVTLDSGIRPAGNWNFVGVQERRPIASQQIAHRRVRPGTGQKLVLVAR